MWLKKMTLLRSKFGPELSSGLNKTGTTWILYLKIFLNSSKFGIHDKEYLFIREEILSWVWPLRGTCHTNLYLRGTEQYNKVFTCSILINALFRNVWKQMIKILLNLGYGYVSTFLSLGIYHYIGTCIQNFLHNFLWLLLILYPIFLLL